MEGPAEVLVEAVVDDGVAARVEVGAPQEEAAQPRRVVHERRQLQEWRGHVTCDVCTERGWKVTQNLTKGREVGTDRGRIPKIWQTS